MWIAKNDDTLINLTEVIRIDIAGDNIRFEFGNRHHQDVHLWFESHEIAQRELENIIYCINNQKPFYKINFFQS